MKYTIKQAVIVAIIATLGGVGYYTNEVSTHTKIKISTEEAPNTEIVTLDAPAPNRAIKPHTIVEDLPIVEAPEAPAVKTTKIILEKGNTYVFQGPVTQDSVGKAIYEIGKMDNKLTPGKDIFLFLDTPGGSVFDGVQFIDYIQSLDRKVHTVSLFAASMGFQIVQNLDTRYIVGEAGTLMSHRARLSGLSGQVYGELETRYNMIKSVIDMLDIKAAARMQITHDDYRQLIVHEYWTMGTSAVKDRAADERAKVICGKTLSGTNEIEGAFMGISFTAVLPACPLAKTLLDVRINRGPGTNAETENPTSNELKQVHEYFNSKLFFEKYIRSGLVDISK